MPKKPPKKKIIPKKQVSKHIKKLDKLEKKKNSLEGKILNLRRDLLEYALAKNMEEVKNKTTRFSVVAPVEVDFIPDKIAEVFSKKKKKLKAAGVKLSDIVQTRIETVEHTDIDVETLEQLVADKVLTVKDYEKMFVSIPKQPHLRRDPRYGKD